MSEVSASILHQIPSSHWRQSKPPENSDAAIEWCPLAVFGERPLAIGLSRQGAWVWGGLGDAHVTAFPVNGPTAVGILPVLEVPLFLVKKRVAETSSKLGLDPRQIVASFPILEIVQAALRTRSDYWIDHALSWFESEGPYTEVPDEFFSAAVDRSLSQRNRHRLRRILKSTP